MNNNRQLKTMAVNGVELAYFEKGDGPLVICLHGFPDTAYGMGAMVDELAGAGYRAVAPFLRGYAPSSLAADNDYSLPTVARDIAALVDGLYSGEGEAKALLIGHDWGGLTAYHVANLAPEKVAALAVLSIPHMANAKTSWQQFKNMWYILFFQLPKIPERAISKNNFAFIDKLYQRWSPSWRQAEANIQAFKAAIKDPAVLKATLAYYRQMVQKPTAESKALLTQVTTVPSLWFMGDEDGCVAVDQMNGLEHSFTQAVKLVIVEGAGHFPHCEKPAVVYEALLPFLAANK